MKVNYAIIIKSLGLSPGLLQKQELLERCFWLDGRAEKSSFSWEVWNESQRAGMRALGLVYRMVLE